MIKERLEQIKQAAERATEGPWYVRNMNGDKPNDIHIKSRPDTLATTAFYGWLDQEKANNADFIALARSAVPELIAEIERLNRYHDSFCEDAQEKTDKDIFVMHRHIESLTAERDDLRFLLNSINSKLFPGEVDSIDSLRSVIKERDRLKMENEELKRRLGE